jgi:FMN phosphatase YigB (HAD superfamily)
VIEALVFDLGNVIVRHDNRVLYERLRSRCSEPWTVERIGALAERPDWGTGAPIADLHRELRESAGYSGDWAQLAEDWCCHLVLDGSMLDLVEHLAARHRVMIFSNTNAVHWDSQVAASGGRLARIEAYLSHEIGRLKPDVAAFAKVAELAGIDPARSLFFDDVAANVAGARAAGFQAELFVDEAGLRASLQARGLLD